MAAMWYNKPTFKNLVIVVLILLAIYLCYILLPLIGTIAAFIIKILYPLFLTIIFYYLVRPSLRYLQRRLPTPLSIMIIYFVLAALLVVMGLFIYPVLMQQIEVVKSIKVKEHLEHLDILNSLNKVKDFLAGFLGSANTVIINSVTNFISGATELVLDLLIVPFILYYLLADGKKIYIGFCNLIPPTYLHDVRNWLEDIDETLEDFIVGRVIIAAFSAALAFILLLIIGIDYAFILALISFIFYIIPTLGAYIAMIPPILVGFSTSNIMGIEAIIVMSIVSGIEGFLITPQVLKKKLFIHPLTVIFILLITGALWGIFGLLISIPAYAILKITITHLYAFFMKEDETKAESTHHKTAE